MIVLVEAWWLYRLHRWNRLLGGLVLKVSMILLCQTGNVENLWRKQHEFSAYFCSANGCLKILGFHFTINIYKRCHFWDHPCRNMSSHPDVSQQNWWTFDMEGAANPGWARAEDSNAGMFEKNEWTCPIWWEEDKNMLEDSQRNNQNCIWMKSNEFLDIIHQHWPLTRWLAQFAWL